MFYFAEPSAATGTSADLKSETQTDTQTDTNTDSNSKSVEKPKSPKKSTPKSSEESGDPSEKRLLGEKETVADRPEKTGLTDSGQGDSQA